MKKSAELIFIPSPGIGHIISTVEVAKLILSRDDSLFVTVIIIKLPFKSDGADDYIASLAADPSSQTRRIKFLNLPQQEFEQKDVGSAASLFKFLGKHRSHVRDAVAELVENTTRKVAGLVLDMFCTDMVDVAEELELASYLFHASGAAVLGLCLHLQALRDEHSMDCTKFKDDGAAELICPSFLNPLPAAKVLPRMIFNKEACDMFLDFTKRYRDTKGILVNSFFDLESHALRSLSSDLNIPPVYSVGPVLNVGRDDNNLSSDILAWLDGQPPSSVVFLCFGSMGSFGEEQVKEIAQAIEGSGSRFLWSLRQPPKDGMAFPSDYADHGSVLPEGFLDRTEEIGRVIGWAPQVAILSHPAIGGFVTHCGWNSTLESIWFGVPMAAWPLHSEQQLNAFELVRDLGLAVEIDVGYREGSGVIVSRRVVEKGIKEVMAQESVTRKKVKEMSEMSRKALQGGGSSYFSLGNFIDQIQSSLY